MIKRTAKILYITLTVLLLSPLQLFAQQLESDNYKIIDVVTNSSGEATTSQSGAFQLLNSISPFSGDPRLYSNLYRAGLGVVEIFTANVPIISCFETDSSGSSDCTTGPSYLNDNGTVTVCGPQGCYRGARFEIDPQRNPADTLYAIQISRDEFASELMYISGTTRQPIEQQDLTIADFLTKSNWESTAINIDGLHENTQYWIRATALHGDFTQSQPGPSVDATTARASMDFDIDIAGISGITAETSPPYEISFTNARRLIQTGPPNTSADLIWMDAQTNGKGGFAIVQRGQYGGLFSPTQDYTIDSDDGNLDSITEGFGLQNFHTGQIYHTSSTNGSLAEISVMPLYANSGHTVGKVSTSFIKVYEADGPVMQGRMALSSIARASGSTPMDTDYIEQITFVMLPRY